MVNAINSPERIKLDIIKGTKLESYFNDLFINFEAGEQRNAELINRFFEQTYFKGEASLINKLIETNSDIKFEDIEKEGINLALLTDNAWMRDFNDCMHKIRNSEIKRAFIAEIYNKVRTEIGGVPGGAAPPAPYDQFDSECQVLPGSTDVVHYFGKVFDYLVEKEGEGGSAKKAIEILKKINITNEDLNNRLLATGSGIPAGTKLSDTTIPANIGNSFDTLLSFEIGKEADRTISIAKNFSKDYQGLFTNSIPAINTIVGENDEYKYDEKEIILRYPAYQQRKQAILDSTPLNEVAKKQQIKALKREFYLKYLKTKNSKIGNALEQLYNNDFDYSKVDDAVLKDYFDKVVDLRLKKLFDNGMNEFIKLNYGNVDEFKNFYKKIADPSKKIIVLNDVNLVTPDGLTDGGVIIPIHKKIVEGANNWLKDIDEFGKNSVESHDAFPMEFTIYKSDIERLEITIEDKTKLLNFLARFDKGDKYEIKGRDIGNLIYLFFVINSKLPISEFNPKQQKEVEELFGQAKNVKHKEENSEDEEESNATMEEYLPQNFKEEMQKLGPGKFENGSEIWLPMCNSELPGGGYGRMKLKISNVDMTKGTFKGTVFGGELKFNSRLEGKTREFKMNKKTLEEFNRVSKESNKVWLLPNPNGSDFNSFRDKLRGKLGTEELIFPPSGTIWTGDKFILDNSENKDDIEVMHFGSSSDDKSTYKVEYKKNKDCFTVSASFNGDGEGKDGKSKKERFSYKRDMDWNNFLIFFNQKGLIPQTEEEANRALQKQEQEFKIVNGGKWTLNWFSINNIKNGFKDIFGAIKKKIDDYDKSQTEKLKKIIESPILNAIGSIPLLPPSLKYAIGERQQEIYNEKLNGAWTEIEKYLKALQSDGQFADTFEQVPPHVQTIYGESYQQFIIDLFNKENPSEEESRKAAALLLANYEKGGSPFRGLSQYENKGLWVKVLLGKDHYQKFLEDKAACIRDRDIAETSGSEDDKKGLNEQLATCEMDYIINNVRGAYPKLPGQYFPSHENRGIDGDKSTNYIPNPSKQRLSETFANKLEDAKKSRFTQSSVEDTYSKNTSINRFAIMQDDFGKMTSSRYRQGAGALRRMLDLATTEKLKKRAHGHFLAFLLSGVLDVNCDPSLKKEIYKWAKPIGFVPGMLVKEAGVAENVAILLDAATDGDFSRNVTKYFHRNDQLKGGIDFKGLQDQLDKWLTDDMMDKLNHYFSKLPIEDFSSVHDSHKKHILEKFRESLLEEDVEEFDRRLLKNPTIVNNGLLTSIDVVSDRLRFEDGEFKGNDSEDISNKRKFRNDVASAIGSRNYTNPKDVNFVLEKYLSRFGLRSSENRQNIYKWVNTAYHYKKILDSEEVKKNGGVFQCTHQRTNENGRKFDFPLGTITQNDVDRVLLYAFEGKVWERLGGGILPEELKKALDAFQDFFYNAFTNNSLKDKYVKDNSFKSSRLGENDLFLLGGWDAYKKIRDKEIANSSDVDGGEAAADLKDLTRGQRREITRRIFNNEDYDYINPEMESIYKMINRRNSLDEKWKLGISSDRQRNVTGYQEKVSAPDETSDI